MNHRRISHSELKVLMDELVTKAEGKPADYGLTEEIINDLKAGSLLLGADIDDQALKSAASKASTAKLKITRKTVDDLYAKIKRTAKDSGVAADKLAEINIEPNDKIKSKIAIFDPADLVVSGSSNGTNTTKWKANGNKPRTIYNIEAMIGAATDFIIVGTSTTLNFAHKNQKPGVKAVYRVRAQRGNDVSDYSNEATVYDS